MITWNNLDTLESFKELSKVERVDIKEAMSGENGAKRAKAHYNANVLAIPAEFVSLDTAINIIRGWLGTDVLGGRYQERMEVIKEIEKENMK